MAVNLVIIWCQRALVPQLPDLSYFRALENLVQLSLPVLIMSEDF